MLRQVFLAFIVVFVIGDAAIAQTADGNNAALTWRRTGEASSTETFNTEPERLRGEQPIEVARSNPTPTATAPAPLAVEPQKAVFVGATLPATASLPNDAGQVWREYDISAYTTRVTTTKRPEQAVVDWILHDTGYEVWHSEPMGVLTAGPRTIRVYHTPAMQKVVADVVDRFTSSEAASYTFSLRVVTLDSPNWRATGQHLLRSIPVQTPGVNAWMMAREDAAMLVGMLRQRTDYREHSSPYLMVNNGQSTLVSAMRGRPYVREIAMRATTAAGFEPSTGQVDEGFNLDFSPLLSADRRMIDATVKCDVDQIEKMIPVMLDVAGQGAMKQRTKIEVPQISHYRFHERFRWPVDQVLLVGMGMVALPMPVDGAPMVPGVPLPIGNTPARADLLVFVECRGPSTAAGGTQNVPRSSQREAKNYRGRY